MFAVTHRAGFGAGSSGPTTPVALTFTDSSVNANNLEEYTFNTQAIGTASADRHVIVALVYTEAASDTLTSVTVAGQSCTVVVNSTSGSGDSAIAITDAPVTSGTTATIVCSFSGSGPTNCGIGVYSITGLGSTTPVDTDTTTTDNTGLTLNVEADGAVIGVSSQASGATATWTNITENYDEVIETSVMHHTGASVLTAASGTLTLTMNSSSSTSIGVSYASFR